jgi:hypothetical protein
VYGYGYTTFSLLVTVKRKSQSLLTTITEQISTVLYEGFPLKKRLHNELDLFFGHFSPDIATSKSDSSDSLAIIIDVQNQEGKTKTFVKYGGLPTMLDYDLKLSGEGTLRIMPSDPFYHPAGGTYHVLVIPDFSFADFFRDNYYSFSL